jgi:hypothetical protein
MNLFPSAFFKFSFALTTSSSTDILDLKKKRNLNKQVFKFKNNMLIFSNKNLI